MQDQIALGIVLFGLLVAPVLSYGLFSYMKSRNRGPSGSREETMPSSTQAAPSRTIPGGGSRYDD